MSLICPLITENVGVAVDDLPAIRISKKELLFLNNNKKRVRLRASFGIEWMSLMRQGNLLISILCI